ncbi:hypothetical protein AJ80_05020 [Polytolypa hystricis UAMH7299]|uniref:Uncharacterized protein n=1 Tax=Polytolypa hystricis (strain UAMH7299) TaxID=1447883 RepID=A0A2B7Y7U7_POLH7|nr:hypothetical protein AJ80_05020 [Polytolypa hystricis UAMH7299]
MSSVLPNQAESAGGFVHPSLPSPAPSSIFSSSTATPSLPRQRNHPLVPGSSKETSVINHVDSHILTINRRHAKKFSSSFADQADADNGYERFREVAKDIETIVDVLWVSGTPSLQIPYLISLAGLINSYLPDFPFSPRATFRLMRKMDSIFASLLQGEDVETGAILPGFGGRRGIVSTTEKVRIKSITESTRIIIVDVQGRDNVEEDDDLDDVADDDDNDEAGYSDYGDALGRWELESARVYERTIQLLGDELGKQEVS